MAESVIAVQEDALVPQALPAVTHILPLVVEKLTVILVVPCPLATILPDGTVQL